MFYAADDISSELQCPKCEDRFVNPRVLPCGQSICLECILELQQKSVNKSSIMCVCAKQHKIQNNEDGLIFAPNKFLNKILATSFREIYRGKSVEELKSMLESLRAKTDSLDNTVKSHSTNMFDRYASIRNEIDLAAEILIANVNDLRDELLGKLLCESEKCCVKNSKPNEDTYLEEVNEFHANGLKILKMVDLKEEMIEECVGQGSH
jgi:hypothetical protein